MALRPLKYTGKATDILKNYDSFTTLSSFPTEWKPIGSGKVDSFTTIKTVTKTAVVRSREGNDKLAGALHACGDLDTIVFQNLGRELMDGRMGEGNEKNRL